MGQRAVSAVALGIIALLLTARGAGAQASASLVVQVYSDGSVLVTQDLPVSPSAGTVELPLLSPVLSDVVATDQNGSALSWRISGSNITIYTLGSTGVDLSYGTQDLTNKTGTVWSLAFTTGYNATVVLPKSSTVGSVSGVPYSISVQDGHPTLAVSPGAWKIDYGVPLSNPQTGTTGTGTPSTSSGTSTQGAPGGVTGGGPFGGFLGATGPEGGLAIIILLAVAAGLGLFWWRRRPSLGPRSKELRPDDVKVLEFIQEKGGKVLEPEIRMKFALPKTSGWRQIKRLERLGYVKVTKIGSQNQIELVRKKEAAEG